MVGFLPDPKNARGLSKPYIEFHNATVGSFLSCS
jgi:hypothetical protein